MKLPGELLCGDLRHPESKGQKAVMFLIGSRAATQLLRLKHISTFRKSQLPVDE
jgi:hypothetical protein